MMNIFGNCRLQIFRVQVAASILTIGALGGCAAKDDPKEDGNMKDAEAAYAAELPTEKTLAAASEDR